MMVDVIPFVELRDAIGALHRHVVHHLRNAIDEYNNNKKPEALFFAIIAFEELMKLSEYVDSYNKQKGVSEKLHKGLFDHKRKLTTIPRNVSSHLNNISEDNYKSLLSTYNVTLSKGLQSKRSLVKTTEIYREAIAGLDYLKQLILYFDWKDGNEITINRYLNHPITKNHIDHSAAYFIEYVILQLKGVKLKIKYPDNIVYQIPREESILSDDEDWQGIEEFQTKQDAELRYSKDVFFQFLREIKLLGDAVKS